MWKFNMVDGFHLRNHMCDSIVTWFFFLTLQDNAFTYDYRNINKKPHFREKLQTTMLAMQNQM